LGEPEGKDEMIELMKSTIIISVLCLCFNLALGQADIRTRQFNLEDGIAIQGYDPVAYFVQNKAVKGKKDLALEKDGVTYYFSSLSNKDIFIKNSPNYEPQYGGWCAYAMGTSGEKVEIDPETFKILDGKLYLFYNSLFNNTLPKWEKAEVDLQVKADKNWKVIYK
jgi:YHS domain-containing protein